MNTERQDIFRYFHYLFIFAHPDDEIYTCAYIKELVTRGKVVDLLYVTSGDYHGPQMIAVREGEVARAMDALGVAMTSVHFMRIPERQVMGSVRDIGEKTLSFAAELMPDCIIGHDFEGGHNGHDAVSFCAARTAEKLQVPFYVFPAYHAWPEKRLWNQFVVSREATDTLELSEDMKDAQQRVIAAHASQAVFFDAIRKSDSYEAFSTREVVRLVSHPIDYRQPPATPVGYEYPGSSIHFTDFTAAIASVETGVSV